MKWHEITIQTTEEATEMISNFLHDLGSGGVSIEESGTLNKKRDTSLGQWYELPLNDIPEGEALIKGYFADAGAEQLNAWVQQLEQSIQGLKAFSINIGKATITYKEVHESDWANEWKQYFKPINISERLVIKPTWEAYDAQENELIIEMDPGMAFGTGTHETTALCLRTIEQIIQTEDQVIDIGTGSGVLAIAAAKLGAQHVLAIDLDPVAIASARENTKLNGLSEQITVIEGDLLNTVNKSQMRREQDQLLEDQLTGQQVGITLPVQLVIANILAEIILTFIADVYDVLAPGGHYIASGIIKKKEADVVAGLETAGFTIVDCVYENDWVAIVARKA